MASEPESSDEELLAGIYQGDLEARLQVRPRSQFEPWHLPRKHFIRTNQWCKETRALLKRVASPEKSIRYLGLPGEDLLDIRAMRGVCAKAKATLHYLGFDRSLKSGRMQLSEHEVNSDPFISETSFVVRDMLEDVAKSDSMAYKYASQNAPYDVINLDPCGSVTLQGDEGVLPFLEAIRTLCDIQIKRRSEPWLLFLTTRAVRQDVDVKLMSRFFEQLLKNMKGSESFKAAALMQLKLEETALLEELRKPGTVSDLDWLNAYVLAMSKWLLAYMIGAPYTVPVEMLQSYRYSVKRGKPDMLSLAFLLEPADRGRIDKTGLTRNKVVVPSPVIEEDLATRMVNKVADIIDVDEFLAENNAIYQKTLTKSSAMLSGLGYDMKEYKRYVLQRTGS